MTNPQLSVVIPAFNEQSRLPDYLQKISVYLEGRGIDYEVIVVDDGSTDATRRVVETLSKENQRIQLLHFHENRGKGAAVRSGMLHSSGRLRLFADADGSTPISELERLEKAMGRGVDVAVGSRAIRSQSTRVRGTLRRKVAGTIFNMIVQAIAVPGILDTQCGFKLFTDHATKETFKLQTIDDFGFDVEILFLARKRGLCIEEVPINWTDVPGSKVRLGRDSFTMLKDVFTVRWNNLRARYSI